MENDRDQLAASLRETARAEAAPWTDFPPTPAWYPPATGLWAAFFVVASTVLDEHRLWQAGFYLALVLAAGVFLGWQRRVRGTMPDLRAMPPAFRAPAAWFVGGVLLVVVVVIAVVAWTTPWIAAVVALIGVSLGVGLYERAYASAARRTVESIG